MVFENPYPDLPNLKVGQVPWPTGIQRYARALFAVDYWSLAEISHKAWGYEIPANPPDIEGDAPKKFKPDLPPEDWGYSFESVKLRMEYDEVLEIDMYALTPVRVAHASFDLWLLPLVDQRFLWLRKYGKLEGDWSSGDAWKTLWIEAGAELALSTLSLGTAVPATFGKPDAICRSESVPVVQLLDATALTTGKRVVVDPVGGVRLQDVALAKLRRNELERRPIVSGGSSGKINRPEKLKVLTRRVDDLYSGHNRWESYDRAFEESGDRGPSISIFSLWNIYYKANVLDTTFPDRAEFRAYINALADIWKEWLSDEYYYCLAGFQSILPSGFDAWIIWEFTDKVTTKVKSLSQRFAPRFLLAQTPYEGGFHATGGLLDAKAASAITAGTQTSPTFGFATVFDFSGGHTGPSASEVGVALTRQAEIRNSFSSPIAINASLMIVANETVNPKGAHPTPWRIPGEDCS